MGNHNTQYFQTILLNNQSELKFMLRAKNVSQSKLVSAKSETLLDVFCSSRDKRKYPPFVFYQKR